MNKRSALLALMGVLLCGTASSSAHADDHSTAAYPAWRVELVGHRGLSPDLPENTMAAFRNSIALGVDVIELDLRGTADGEVVILHDETVDRTTDGSGVVTEMTLAEVKALDAGSYVDPRFSEERIPTYGEVLELARGTGVKLLLDIKISPVLDKERIVRLTEEYGATLDVIVGVRTVEDLREFRELNPNLRVLGFIPDTSAIEGFAAAGVDIIRLWPDWIREDRDSKGCRRDYLFRRFLANKGLRPHAGSASCLVQKVHDLGKPVWTTANDAPREELDELIRLRVNGILTDLPEVLADLLKKIRTRQ